MRRSDDTGARSADRQGFVFARGSLGKTPLLNSFPL
jgi:hypothetical protein